MNSVMFGDGVADALPEGRAGAQMGTIVVAEILGIRDQLGAGRPGVLFVDTPVSGSQGSDWLGVGHAQLAEIIEGARWTLRSPTPCSTR
jgi:3-hydroxyisobutyrate dehydrogenase-like beta-hydroxyacid dehydrogenase